MSKFFPILFFLCTLPAAGQELHAILNTVVVTGTRSEVRRLDSPVATTLVTRGEIVRSGAATVTETLTNTIPGLVFTPNAMGNNLRIRGLSTRYVLILVDGERMTPEGAGGNVNLDRVALGDVERIEIVNGAASALWGAGAVGAVVNIITQRGSGVQASVEAGSHRTLRIGASAGLENVRASGFRNSSQGLEGAFTGMPYTDWGASAKGSQRLGKRVELAADGRFFSHETFNSAGMLATTHKLAHSWSAGVGAEVEPSAKNILNLKINTDNYIDYDVLERLKNQHRKQNRSSIQTLRAVDNHVFNARWRLTTGIEASRQTAFAASTMGGEPATLGVNEGAAFGQASWRHRQLELTAGGRYTQNSQFGGAFSPSMAAMWQRGNWRLRGGVGTAFRAPSIKELHYDFDHQGMFWIYGNPDLKPEKGVYSQLNAEYASGQIAVSGTLYRNDIRNKITQYAVAGSTTELHYKNVGSATLQGFEASLMWAPADRWTVQTTYNFCDAVDNSTRRQLDSNPRHSATGAVTWTGWLTAQTGVRHTSPFTTLSTTGVSTRQKAGTVLRAAVSRELWWGFSLAARVENIFNQRSALNPEGRIFSVSLKWKT